MAEDILTTIPVTKEVAEVDEKIKRLDEELAAMEKRREEIENEKIELGKARIAALAQTAPVNKMLPELLMRVFEYAATESESEGVELPLRLVLVSHQWRKLALNTPRAWGRVAFTVEEESSARPMIRRAEAFLERSGATALDVFLDILSWSQSDDRPRLLKEMVTLLVPHMGRCVKLVCRAREEADSPLILSTLTPHFGPSLTNFSMESRESVRMELPAMPYVTHLSVDDVGPRNGWTSPLLSNLKSLSLRYFKPIAFEPFLSSLESAADNLEELRIARCTLSFENHAFMFTDNERRPLFPKLKKILMTDVLAGDVDVIFESLHAPALEEVLIGLDSARFRYFKFMDPETATCLSRCPLKKLEVEDSTIEGSDLRSLLALLKAVGPTLEELTVGGEIDLRFFHAMEVDARMLPNLRSLCIKKQNDLTGREIVRIVQARIGRDGITPISLIGVERCRAWEHDSGDQLKRMGVKMNFIPY